MPGDSWTALVCWSLGVLPFLVIYVQAECTFEQNTTHIVSDFSSGTPLAGATPSTTAQQCKDGCVDSCVGVVYYPTVPDYCYLYDTYPDNMQARSFESYTYYSRNCPEASCTMQEVSDMAVTSTTSAFVDLAASASTCKALCTWVSECLGITFHASSSTCVLHASTVSTSSVENYLFSRKNECDGKQCCLDDDEEDTEGSSATTYTLDLSSKLQSCRDMCVFTSSCVALTFSDDRCSLYNASSLQTDSSSGQSYYSKDCNGGSLTIVYTCNRTHIALLSHLLGVCVTAIHAVLFL